MKITKKQVEEIYARVEQSYPEQEIGGLYSEVLHTKSTIKYLEDLRVKQQYIEGFGEVQYKEALRKHNEKLKLKEVELSVLIEELCE